MCRLLDREYSTLIKSCEPDFVWTKMHSLRELSGEVVEEFMQAATSKVEESRKKSWNAAFHAFRLYTLVHVYKLCMFSLYAQHCRLVWTCF